MEDDVRMGEGFCGNGGRTCALLGETFSCREGNIDFSGDVKGFSGVEARVL